MNGTRATPAGAIGSPAGGSAARVSDVDVIAGLIRRELKIRFGEEWFGFIGAYLAPLVWIAAVYLAFMFFGRSSPVHTDLITFIVSGLVPYASFRYTVNAIGRSRSLVRNLLVYPSVRRRHAVAATALVEYANSFLIVAVVMAVNYVFFGNWEMQNPLGFAFGITLAWALGVAFGYIFNNLAEMNKIWWIVGQSILRPSFFISAVFFTGNEVPERLYRYLGWNPLLHAAEVTRTAMLVNYESRVADVGYIIVSIAVLGAAGLLVRLLMRD